MIDFGKFLNFEGVCFRKILQLKGLCEANNQFFLLVILKQNYQQYCFEFHQYAYLPITNLALQNQLKLFQILQLIEAKRYQQKISIINQNLYL
ncbi:hypothetical protein pb186bvf_001130 [Paramecium bursaria]